MDAEQQTALVFDMMVAIAPEVARFHLRILSNRTGTPYSVSEEVLAQARRETATSNANVTLEFAMHLAAAFARCQTSIGETNPAQTQDAAQTQQETAPADKPRKTKPPPRIQPPASGVPEGTSPVPDLPEHRD
jgi:hypothetical protein